MNPIEKFKDWYNEELLKSSVKIPSACCLSTTGLDGYPNSRFVSLKDVVDDKFVVTGPMNSRKGLELLDNPKASLTFWWTETERQVRVQGDATMLEDNLADDYFKERNRDSQIVNTIFDQGKEIESFDELERVYEIKKTEFERKEIPRPKNWGGFYIIPKRIEFMVFKESRFHLRELNIRVGSGWKTQQLQP